MSQLGLGQLLNTPENEYNYSGDLSTVFIHVFKTTNLVNCKSYIGIHATDDIFYGTPDFYDDHIGSQDKLLQDLSQFGRQNFHVQSLHAFHTYSDAQSFKDRVCTPQYLIGNTYNKISYVPDYKLAHKRRKELSVAGLLKIKVTPEFCALRSRVAIAHNLSQYLGQRSNTIWITDEVKNYALDANESIPTGFRRGLAYKKRTGGFVRSASFREKVSVTMKQKHLQSSSIISIDSVI